MINVERIRTAVVTGGSSGIGLAVARLLSNDGLRLVVTGRDERRLGEAAARLGCRALRLDLSDRNSVDDLFRELGADPVDFFVANAGSLVRNPDDQRAETRGAVEVVSRAAALVADGGVLAVTNTLFAHLPLERVPRLFRSYAEGKRDLARQLAEVAAAYPGVRAVDVALGFVPGTRLLAQVMSPAEAAEYASKAASAALGGKLTTVRDASEFLVRIIRHTAGGVRVGIDGSCTDLSEIVALVP
ncbi:SDR family oxidoreductase [Amycolatopsis sp. NPDC059090]|uniref:SDR family oxidoreductase n=1 Tax=unclassified Amycolatopsis TaxID=2618356 RepID=UPI003671EF52